MVDALWTIKLFLRKSCTGCAKYPLPCKALHSGQMKAILSTATLGTGQRCAPVGVFHGARGQPGPPAGMGGRDLKKPKVTGAGRAGAGSTGSRAPAGFNSSHKVKFYWEKARKTCKKPLHLQVLHFRMS